MTYTEKPTVNSLLVADHVYRDIESRKWIISGVFNTIGLRSFPAKYPSMEVFFQLTNVGKEVDLHFRVENAETGDAIVEFGGPIASASPLEVVEKKVALQGIQFPAPGKYWVQLMSAEEILCQSPLYVKEVKPPQQRRRRDLGEDEPDTTAGDA